MRTFIIFCLSVTLLFLAACQGNELGETAVQSQNSPTPPIVNTAVPPTNTPPPPPPVIEEELPTNAPDQPTATNAPPTEPPPTPTPTITPIPENPVSSISLAPVISGLTQPLYLTHAFDDRLFIVEQDGLIKIFQNGALLATPFIDLTGPVGYNSNEQGLLGLAFHPNYQENGFFFVNYTDENGRTNIARYRVSDDPNVADPASGQILLTIPQPFANHNGGMVAFGPDGYLYVGMGDGGSQGDPQNHGQNPGTLLGSILRLDVNSADGIYTIPADNPFINDTNARPEVWAYGFRNPWRFSFDRDSDDFFVADVGQNAWEEVSWLASDTPSGQNFGWNPMEGNYCYLQNCDSTGFVPAIFEYNHSLGCSISGGYIYRGQQYLSLYGNYFVADFCSGTIWGIFQNADGSWQSAIVHESGLPINSFGEDINGELYVVARTGQIFQIRP
ncbi:PQQ-dependent sugar dehydrogenase [Candidatus Leptofilum sp.]|uniref:PQQ-dependent sugar dehydrogenase n=1 Tax=Candidatus Leptofilum sp. TaxID=3241576 RepID=UPI003B5A3ACA